MVVSGIEKVSLAVPPVPSLEESLTQLDPLSAARFAGLSDEARLLRERQNELKIRLRGVEGAVGSMTPELTALDLMVAGLELFSYMVQAKTLPAPGAHTKGEPNNSKNEWRNIQLDAALQAAVARPSINVPDLQYLFDTVQEPSKKDNPSATAASVTTTNGPLLFLRRWRLVGSLLLWAHTHRGWKRCHSCCLHSQQWQITATKISPTPLPYLPEQI